MQTPHLITFLCLTSCAAVAQTTWTVDAGGNGDFTSLAAAHDGAQAGDTLLVQPGSYASLFRDPAKGVRILGNGPGVVVNGRIDLANVPSGQTLQLSGLTIDATNLPAGGAPSAINVDTCSNLVLSDLEVLGPHEGTLDFEGGPAIQLLHCDGVLANVTAVGGNGGDAQWDGTQGGEGAFCLLCNLAFSDCHFTAGDSGTGQGGTPATSPPLLLGGGEHAVDECTLVPGTPNSTGGALAVNNAHVLVANHLGGIPSYYTTTGTIEYAGAAMTPMFFSSLATLRPQPGLVGPSNVAIGMPLQWTLHGTPNKAAAVAASLGSVPLPFPSLFDTWLFTATHPTSTLLTAVVTGPAGATTFSTGIPNDPLLIDTVVFAQAAGWIDQPTWKASGVTVTRIN